MAQANLKAVITAEDKASSVIGGVGSSFGKLTAAFAAGQLAAQAVSKAIQVVVDVVKQSVGAAFQQVRQVENATFALKAYEKNGAKVNKVLSELIDYARSDLGTLFKREDLFAAASTLKMYGQSTDSLTDKVKILSKGVSLGKTTFQELSQIVGRAAAKGRLDAVDFDMLIERGIGLDRTFRGAKVTSEELFKALDKALPAELLAGRANTIDGAFIRLQTSLRDLGGAILGVDKKTTTFIEGGLGDRFMKAVGNFRNLLASDSVKNTLLQIGSALGVMAGFVGTVVVKLAEFYAFYMKAVGPSLNQLWNTIKVELIPALQQLWQQLGPILTPALKEIGKVILALVIISILALAKAIRILVIVSAAVVRVEAQVIAIFRGVVSQVAAAIGAFNRLRASITATVSNVFAIITDPYRKAFNFIIGGISKVKDAFQSISPQNLIGKGLKKLGINIPGFASGIRDFGGGVAMVGENGPEKVLLPKGSSVMPASRSGNNGTINITVQAGAYMGNKQDARRYAQEIFNALKDVAQSNGMTMNQMIGQ